MIVDVKCRFCAYAHDEQPDLVNQAWLAADKHMAMVSKGALVPGWSLVCPKHHTYSLRDSYRDSAFLEFASRAVGHVRDAFGEVRVFEHGALKAGSQTGCGTDHAHMHVVPLAFSLEAEAAGLASHLVWRPCRLAELGERVADTEYLFVADEWQGERTAGLLALLPTGESQFFRRVIASRLGLPDLYDYRRFPMDEVAGRTQRILAQAALVGSEI